MINATFSEIADALRTHDDFIVCGHTNPDGDCIGSVLGMTALLRALGKHVQPIVALTEPLSSAFAHLPGVDGLVEVEDAKPAATFISVDAAGANRLGDEASVLRDQAQFLITLDHHEVPSCEANLYYIDPAAPSATCLVWEVVKASGVSLSQDIATCCYAGLMTDTGRFQFQNSTPYAFEVASEMVATGINPSKISTNFFQSKSIAALHLEALAVDRMELLCNGTVSFSWIDVEDMARLGACKADTEGIIDILRSVGQVHVACLLKDHGTEVRGSIRAKDDTNVAAWAQQFDGGGHKAAAGFTLHCPMDEAIMRVKDALEAAFS